MSADGELLLGSEMKVGKVSDVRDELVSKAENEKLTAENNFWIEYDGMIYNTIELRAKKDVKTVTLRIPFKPEHSQYAHLTEAGFGNGGGRTQEVDKSFNDGFWPVIWIGDFERGLCWFSETVDDLSIKTNQPVRVDKKDGQTTLTIVVAEDISAGEKVTVKFGFLATPVKPNHKRYPLNILAGGFIGRQSAERRAVTAGFSWGETLGFRDFKIYDKGNKEGRDLGKSLAGQIKRSKPMKVLPYMTPWTIPTEYPEATHYRREWEILPARHSRANRDAPNEKGEPILDCWMSVASDSYRRFYTYKLRNMIKNTGLEGIYCDFGVAMRDNNRYHGANGGVPLLALRDLYRRVANEFVKAGVDDYTIMCHNSMTMQIPSLTYITHFYNGENHRVQSGSTLHDGKDYLDTLPLYYYGIEHSGLPWGIHGNMLIQLQEPPQVLAKYNIPDKSSEYLWNKSGSVIMPILLHNSLPAGILVSSEYYHRVYDTLCNFDIPTAEFHPYWRNQDAIKVDNSDFKVSFYSRSGSPNLLLVVGNLGKQDGEVTVKIKTTGEIKQAIEKIGQREARILDTGPDYIKFWVRSHSMALVELTKK